ncbi:[acyl-carrier-protein] S-malonyltransferase, partial [candidate division KSB1 bacterium]
MKLALIFPGQASQYVGMGKDLCERYPLANEFYDKASDVLEFDLKQISFQGPEEELKQTRITQPAIFVHSVIVAHLLAERGVRPAIVAGHSLGEYSALVGAQAISFEDGLQLVKLRGELMQQAGNRNPGT